MTVFILTLSLFRKINQTKLVSRFHIPSLVVEFTYKIFAFLTTLDIKNFESHLQ